ncbi:MAG: bifunctional DNA-formamidopyrimidine glycosylase/DNA-(apurinic or apyrimidinic site) lyase [Candidatus Saccharimonadales bacterium]
MPELPEVETIRTGLNRLLPGRTFKTVTHNNPKSFPNAETDVAGFLIGASVAVVRRRAKVLIINLSSEYSLLIHLKMTGQLVFVGNERFGGGHPNDSLAAALPDKSTRVEFTFTDGSKLFFNDQRKFGWVRLMPTVEIPNIDFMRKVGPEPLEDGFTAAILFDRLQRRKNTTIKAAILDQTVLAGIGNIYADESLWGAQIHPATLVRDLLRPKIAKLFKEIRYILDFSIQKGGSSNRNYVNAEGKKGSYMDFARVYRREGLPCPRCGNTIIKLRVAGRGTHICPHDQKLV